MSEVAPIEVFPRENWILRNFRILSSADFPTCTKELKISRVSGLPHVLRLKTCTKELVISGTSWNSVGARSGPSQLGNITSSASASGIPKEEFFLLGSKRKNSSFWDPKRKNSSF